MREMARWVQTIAVFAITALVGNLQCDGLCLASLCKTSTGCHPSSRSSNDGHAGCHYRISNAAGVEASPDFAKLPVVSLPVAAHTLIWPVLVPVRQACSQLLERGSPPGKFSVLRI